MENKDTFYYKTRTFSKDSKLHRYLAYKCPGFITITKKEYSLFEILLALKKVICSDKLFDPENPCIILCDDYMEDAPDVKAIHANEIRYQVLKHFIPVEESNIEQIQMTQTVRVPTDTLTLPSWASTSANAIVARQNATKYFDIEGEYVVKPDFLNVLRSVDGVDQNQTIFQYKDILKLFSQYIMTNKHLLFDERNIRVMLVENDQLGKCFGVKAFARGQTISLLRTQLMPLNTTEAIANTHQVSSSTIALNSDSCSVGENENQSNCRNGQTLPAIVQNSAHEEERYSFQNTYRVEYEIDDETDTDQNKSDSSDDDSEIDNVEFYNSVSTLQNSDMAYWGDSETTKTCETDNEIQTTIAKNFKCISCAIFVGSIRIYCNVCWNYRKIWIPEHKRPKKRSIIRKDSQNKKIKYNNIEDCTSCDLCSICFINPKNASFIHGQSSHQVCCYPCAKRIIKQKETCPICRRKIEKITKHFIY